MLSNEVSGTVLLQKHLCKTVHRYANELCMYFQFHSFEMSIFILKKKYNEQSKKNK